MYRRLYLPHFKKQLKPYLKKYPHLKEGLIKALKNFDKIRHVSLGKNLYKIRIRTKDIPRGKSKSFRLVVTVIEIQRLLLPIAIYFKGNRENINLIALNHHLRTILFEAKMQKLIP